MFIPSLHYQQTNQIAVQFKTLIASSKDYYLFIFKSSYKLLFTSLSQRCSPQSAQNYKSGRDTALQLAMQQNDLWNWKPESKIVFCHGDKDDYVPLFNSEKAYSTMKAKGADVTLNVFKGATHTSGVYNFALIAVNTFGKEK